jgi:tetratricopeptide (TPR) repeat protein
MSPERAWKDRLKNYQGRGYALWLAIALLVLLLRGADLLSRGWTNAGMTALAQISTSASDESPIQVVAQAERVLRWAMVWDEKHSGTHRGLGWTLAMRGETKEAGIEWQAGGFTAQELIEAGEKARKAEQHKEALEWYGRAAWVEPELGDPWHYIGLEYEREERWEEALEAYKRATEAGSFTSVQRSSPHYRIGMIYRWRLDPIQMEQALAAFEEAIKVDDFQSSWEAADAHFQRGSILRWQGEKPQMYAAEFQRAVAIHPEHAMAHVLLGTTYYELYGDVEAAVKEIRGALALQPENKWAHLHLGDVYRNAGLCKEAEESYRQALEIDPAFDLAATHLEAACERR